MSPILSGRAAEAEAKLKRLYDAIENGVIDVSDPSLKDRVAELTASRDQAKGDAERAMARIAKIGPAITPESVCAFAAADTSGHFAEVSLAPCPAFRHHRFRLGRLVPSCSQKLSAYSPCLQSAPASRAKFRT